MVAGADGTRLLTNWTERLRQFAARKTAEATGASLPPYHTGLEHPAGSLIKIGNTWTRQLFDGAFYLSPPSSPDRPACSLVFVRSRDGNTGAGNPAALGGGLTDKHLIYEGLSRVAADGVLSGAETIREGNTVLSVWHPELVRLRESLGKPRHPTQIVATLRGLEIDRGLLYNIPEIRVVVITVGSCERSMQRALAERPWITSIAMDSPGALPEAFERIRSLGIERISGIGGRRLATQLIDAGLVQDVYLTTSAREGGEPNTPMYPKPLAGDVLVRKFGTREETGVAFEHIRLARAN